MLNLLHTDTTTVSRETLRWAPIDAIDDNPYQTRQNYKPVHLLRLAASIASMRHELPGTLGLQQPPVARLVAPNGCGVDAGLIGDLGGADELRALLADGYRLQLAFGHSRLRAWRMLAMGVNGMTGIRVVPDDIREAVGTEDWPHLASNDYQAMPVMLVALKDDQMWRQAVSENAQRQDITAIEQALALRVAVEDLGMSVTGAAATFGWSRSTASNKLRLLQLPAFVQQAIATGQWTERHGRAALRLLVAPEADAVEYMQALLGSTTTMTVDDMERRIDAFFNRYLVVDTYVANDVLDMPGADQVEKLPAIVGRCAGCQHLLKTADGNNRCTQTVQRDPYGTPDAEIKSCVRAKTRMESAIARIRVAEEMRKNREALRPGPATETQAHGANGHFVNNATATRLETEGANSHKPPALWPAGPAPVTRVATAMADGSVVEVSPDLPQSAPPGHALYVHPQRLVEAKNHIVALLLDAENLEKAIGPSWGAGDVWERLRGLGRLCDEALRLRGLEA